MLDNIKTPEELKEQLLKIYDKSTVVPSHRAKWSKANPTYGQCVPTTLLVQELFGGDIYYLTANKHYYNVIDGKIIDLTKDQFDYKLDYSKARKRNAPFKTGAMQRLAILKEKLKAPEKTTK